MRKSSQMLWLERYAPERLDGRSLAILHDGFRAERAFLDEFALAISNDSAAQTEAATSYYSQIVNMLRRIENVTAYRAYRGLLPTGKETE